jgi:hydrophobic/amphiphilic exporter-1 (mainly G- bacteria), HAE1 family
VSLAAAVSFTLRRRVTILVLAMLVVGTGVMSVLRLPVELIPSGLTRARVTVSIPVPSANPSEVQETIVRPTEENLRTIPGVASIYTQAHVNFARLSIEFSKDVDLDAAVAEVRDRVERSRPAWPSEARRFEINRFNLDTDIPVVAFGFSFDERGDDFTFVVEESVVKPLEAVNGVARVQVWGLLDDVVRIYVDRERALAAGVDLYLLSQELEKANLDVSGGEIEEGGVRFTLKTAGRFRTLEDVRSYPIRPGLRLDRIAEVRPEQAVRDFIALSNNRFALWCQVMKESGANTVATCDAVRAVLENRIANDPRLKDAGIRLHPEIFFDQGRLIRSAIDNLVDTALDGAWLAIAVLVWFLRRLRLTAVVAIAIPFSLLMTAAATAATGGTLNLLSLVGVTIAVGMLVDNAIVVVECVLQKRNEGLSPLAAARAGASEVALAVTMSTSTTIVAFLPIIFMSGDRDATFFTRAVGLPLCFAVGSSLLVALVFTPLATVALYRAGRSKPDSPIVAKLRRSIVFEALANAYARTLDRALESPGRTALVAALLVVGVTALVWKDVPRADQLNDDGGEIETNVALDANYTLSDAYAVFTELGRAIDSKKEALGVRDYWAFFTRKGGRLEARLSTRDPRETERVAAELRNVLPKIPGARVQTGRKNDGSEKSKVRFRLVGPEVETLEVLARDAAESIRALDFVARADSDLEAAAREIHIRPDRALLNRLGIVPEALWGTVQYGVRGFPLNELATPKREIPLVVMFEGGDEASLDELRETPLFSRTGGRVPMSAVADVAPARGFTEIRRENGKARAVVEADVSDATKSEDVRKAALALLARTPLPEGYAWEDLLGREIEEGMTEMKIAVALAAIFVFLLMGVMFESFVSPFAVLLSAPFSWAGALWLLAVTKEPLDTVGTIGFVLLVGVVVNNGIVLIDCARRRREEGLSRRAALVDAGRLRLRPILMTSMTTIAGLLPTAAAGASNSQISYKSLSLVVIGGMTTATLLQLYVVPAAYALLDDFRLNAGAALAALFGRREDRAT